MTDSNRYQIVVDTICEGGWQVYIYGTVKPLVGLSVADGILVNLDGVRMSNEEFAALEKVTKGNTLSVDMIGSVYICQQAVANGMFKTLEFADVKNVRVEPRSAPIVKRKIPSPT